MLAVAFPALSGNLTLINLLLVFIYIGAAYFVGEQFLKKISIINEISSLIKIGLYIILGSIICGILFMIIPYSGFLYLLFILFILNIYRFKKIELNFSVYHFLCLCPFIIILFQTYELEYAIRERFSRGDGDYFYYTALVESLKTNQSINSAVFHLGLPINYPSLPFMAPALLANFTNIPSQFALWGIYMKILPVACLSTVGYTIVRLYEIVFKVVQKDSKRFPWKLLITGLLLLFLGPIHFINLLKFDVQNTLFLGSGYLLPTGSPGFSLAMMLSSILLLIVISTNKFTLFEGAVIIILLCFVLASKIALFVPLLILIGLLSIRQFVNNEKNLFLILLTALPFFILTYVFLIGFINSVMSVNLTENGYFRKYFTELALKYQIPGHGQLQLLMMTTIAIVMWLSIKFLILGFAYKNLYKNNTNAITLITASVITFFICLVPGFFVENVGKDNAGKLLFDGSFDMEQFVRASVFLLTIVTLIFALYLLYNYPKSWVRKITSFVFSFWCTIIAISFFSNSFTLPISSREDWYVQIKRDFLKAKPRLMAMMGNGDYSGQTATAMGMHPWYCTGIRENNEGYVFTKKGYQRNYSLQNIFDNNTELKRRKTIADSLKMVGIDCIVASPSSMQKIMIAMQDSIISPIPGTKWFYQFN
jgi:hypothetical protein